jgi:hypothetical protein
MRTTVCRRADDPELFARFTGFAERPLMDALEEARRCYPKRFDDVDWHLVTSHAHRKAVNATQNKLMGHIYHKRTGQKPLLAPT